MNDCLRHYEENIDVEQEQGNIKNILENCRKKLR